MLNRVGLAASRFPRTRAAAIPGGGGYKANDKHELRSYFFRFPVPFAQASLAQVPENEKTRLSSGLSFALAERVGFEPTIRSSRIQTFQVCSFNHSDTSPCCGMQT